MENCYDLDLLSAVAFALPAREKDATQYGTGLIVNLPFPESEVTQVVQDVIQNGLIRGTKEYNKDEYITGATPATSTRVFPEWTEGGKVFYKVRLKALDPRNFKDSSDVGTLVVRYVVQPQGDKNTVLRIDARFVEDFRHITHPSNGSVESAEYKDIHDHLDAIESMKAQTVEAEKEKQEQIRQQADSLPGRSRRLCHSTPAALTNSMVATPSGSSAGRMAETPTPQTLEQRVQDLRRQVQRLVKAPGAPLKVRALSHRQHSAIPARRNRGADRDLDDVLAWSGNPRRPARLDLARRIGVGTMTARRERGRAAHG